MTYGGKSYQAWLLGGAAAVAMMHGGAAAAQDTRFDIAPQPLASALNEFSVQSRQSVLFTTDLANAKSSPGVSGEVEVADALSSILAGTGLTWKRQGQTFLVMRVDDPQGGSAAGGGAEVEALIVTAQKREEDIQDVPIAISAFTQEDLTRSQIAGGPDLMTQIPNFTFTKTNFSGYSIQIRGIGTQAISATTDPAVAVAFNNSPTIQNRFFEQEFYDLQRVEVLRGPQGTLYGRNATAGVVNLITQKPRYSFEAKASADVANYSSTRLEGMINLPLVEDRLALRLAGSWTKRDGYVTNEVTGNQIDGRDLWSTRLSLRFDPTDRFSANLIWEHFEEDDDRLRSGKQLCKKDTFPEEIGGIPVPPANTGGGGSPALEILTYLSQGCAPASLYSEESFQTPNGYALPFYYPLGTLTFPVHVGFDVYLNSTQSRDLRVIESSYEPRYKAKTDVVQLQWDFDVSDNLTLASETYYSTDELFSTQDFNRFSTRPGAFNVDSNGGELMIATGLLDENGVFCDPQLGCSDRLTLGDLSTHLATQFGQEFRLSSDFDGPLNFSLGGNFVRYDTVNKYYVFVNSLGLWSAWQWNQRAADNPYTPGVSDNTECLDSLLPGNPLGVYNLAQCIYVDPNPIDNLNDKGHNYFLSKNPYRLISYAVFGEVYYNITPDLKLTAGLRYTVDKKHAPRIPSWLLAGQSVGHPVAEVIEEEWREPTGRLALDWKPALGFTDETLLYASYAHGYKAGGMNPPTFAFATFNGSGASSTHMLERLFFEHPPMFEPEFVDAYELGAKNTLLGGRITLNGSLFYYDYEGYQISEIVNRSALNRNFDAEIWGAELEADWRPLENLKVGLKLGFEKTRVKDGQSAIDLMDRAGGDPNYIVIKPLPTIASNCIVPVSLIQDHGGLNPSTSKIGLTTCEVLYYNEPELAIDNWGFDPRTVPNNGVGIAKDLSGNELPNAPDMTATLTVDYTIPLAGDWLLTLHGDFYRQSEAWTRIINSDPYDRLEPFEQVNFAAIFANEDAGWMVMAYVKNVLDQDNITGAFLNSDDTGLTTNVFLNEPRLYGLRVTKAWTGDPWWGVTPGQPGRVHPLTVELGGMASRIDAPHQVFRPDWVNDFTSPNLSFPMETQDEDLDWGDEREVKIAFRPQAQWQVAARARFGRTNGVAETWRYEFVQGGYYQSTKYPGRRVDDARNGGLSETRDQEKHTLVDFSVGRDLGLGLFGDNERSTVSVGVRYAQFETASRTSMVGIPDYYMPDDMLKYFDNPVTWHEYDSSVSRTGEFRGTGPMVSWEASKALFPIGDLGRANVDWALSGGMLFGKQEASIEGETRARYFSVAEFFRALDSFGPTTVTKTTLTPRTASRDVEIPFFGASLGLSYEIDRFKVGAGYSWERFSDVFDDGIEEARDVDRTIQGPYFRLSVGFGGG